MEFSYIIQILSANTIS